MRFLTGVSTAQTRECGKEMGLGLLLHPANGNEKYIPLHDQYGIDNGCYSKPKTCGGPSYIEWVKKVLAEHGPALFATVPDVIGDAEATLARSREYLSIMRANGFPTAFVLQDGMKIPQIPWADITGVFVGGSVPWKLGPEADEIVQEARHRGLYTHMGKVNGKKRWDYAREHCYDSVDGTYLAFGPKILYPKLIGWSRDNLPHNPACKN